MSTDPSIEQLQTLLRSHSCVIDVFVCRSKEFPSQVIAYLMCAGAADVPASEMVAGIAVSNPSLSERISFVVLNEAALALRPLAFADSAGSDLTDIECVLAEIWKEVLGRQDVDRDSDFFDIGGQSIQAMQVVSRIEHSLGIELQWKAMFETATIPALAQRIIDGDDDRRAHALASMWVSHWKGSHEHA